ncbi:MAG: tetratricopeptide repeat protein [Phycisphaerales bacterium JB065]
MALFGKKKDESENGEATIATADSSSGFQPDATKAAKFFQHAKAVHDSTNYEYAVTLWLQGLRWDPSDISGLEAFFDSAQNFMASGKAKGPTKDQLKNFGGKSAVDRYLVSLLQWGTRPADWQAGLKAMEAANRIDTDMGEQIHWIGEKVLAIAANDQKKAKKDHFVTLMRLFRDAGSYNKAVQAGEIGIRMDPTDSKLIAEVKNMSAEATMSAGGYDNRAEGGFRKNIRDDQKQRELTEDDAVVKTEETLARVIEREKQRLQDSPNDQNVIGKLARLLRERGTPEDEKLAYRVLMGGYERTSNYKFKMEAGEINMRVARRKVRKITDAAAENPEDQELQAKAKSAMRKLIELEIEEYTERVKNYPTDLNLKYELGKRQFQLGNYEEAVRHFQLAKDASGISGQARYYLAQCFLKLDFISEAENTFRDAIASRSDDTGDLTLQLRYGLMEVLEQKARSEEDLDAAKEAMALAGQIAMQQFGYKDITERRRALQDLVNELKD